MIHNFALGGIQKKKRKNVFCPCLCLDPFEAFIIFSIRHEIRRIDLHKRDYSLLVPGLRNTIALDFHFNRSLLYWTDVVEDKIYRGRLSDSGGIQTPVHTSIEVFAIYLKMAVMYFLKRVMSCSSVQAIIEVQDTAGDNVVLFCTIFTYTLS